MSHRFLLSAVAFAALAAPAVAQDWNDDHLIAAIPGFLEDAPLKRLEQVVKLLENESVARAAICARIHGDHREFMLKIERLLGELCDDRWQVREGAERMLGEIGGRARVLIEQHANDPNSPLEESIRCRRILSTLDAKGMEQEQRETQLLRGLVLTAQFMKPDEQLVRALRSVLGHTDSSIVDLGIRALSRVGGADDLPPLRLQIDTKGGIFRQTTLGALSRLEGAGSVEACAALLADEKTAPTEVAALLRGLRLRSDAADLLAKLAEDPRPFVAASARLRLPPDDPAAAPVKVKLTLSDRSAIETNLVHLQTNGTVVEQPVPGLAQGEIPFAECDILDFPAHAAQPVQGVRVFLNQGSMIIGELVGIDGQRVRVNSRLFGLLELNRAEVQGIALDPKVDRLVGASTDHDRVRLLDNSFIDGMVLSADDKAVVIEKKDGGGTERLDRAGLLGLLLTRPRTPEADLRTYQRIDCVSGDRILGFLCASSRTHLGVSTTLLGTAVLPLTEVTHLEMSVGGGAMWGFTLIADFSENKIIEVDDQGRIAHTVPEVFGAWDAECLDNGNLLITEFSVSRVIEMDRSGKTLWSFEDLKNPYDADRLPNGNTLIADTFGSRVIEVNQKKEIVWTFDKDIRPFDCDRLPNGNTLIADIYKDRVIEVDPKGEIVWELKNVQNVHDADRLPNGNTLIVLRTRNCVQEVDRECKVVWELKDLVSPSDADRLPNGNTIVAENQRVREFDRRNNVVWTYATTWSVEVNRY